MTVVELRLTIVHPCNCPVDAVCFLIRCVATNCSVTSPIQVLEKTNGVVDPKKLQKERPQMRFMLPPTGEYVESTGQEDATSESFFCMRPEGEDPVYVSTSSKFCKALKATGNVYTRKVFPRRAVLLPIGDHDLLPKAVQFVKSRKASERVLYALPACDASTLERRRMAEDRRQTQWKAPRSPYSKNQKVQMRPKKANSGTSSQRTSARLSVTDGGFEIAEPPTYENDEQQQMNEFSLPPSAIKAIKQWFSQNLTREDVEGLLVGSPPGTFLVRNGKTSKATKTFVLSMFLGGNACKHYRLPSSGHTFDDPIQMQDSVNGNKSFVTWHSCACRVSCA
eukprot:m.150142 g.150142  ORF g.150142 m.150142 type:complete len:337 (+) comp17825_c0_seq35:2751-3761(+)